MTFAESLQPILTDADPHDIAQLRDNIETIVNAKNDTSDEILARIFWGNYRG